MVSHAIDQGVSKMAAAGILGLSGFTSIFGRVGTGLIADRVGTKGTLIAALVLQAITIALYPLARDAGGLTALGLAFGVGYGGAMPLYAVIAREYFGERILGTAYGSIVFISCIGMGLGSYAGGVIHDALGSYLWLFLGSFAIGTAAAILAVTLRARRRRGPRWRQRDRVDAATRAKPGKIVTVRPGRAQPAVRAARDCRISWTRPVPSVRMAATTAVDRLTIRGPSDEYLR